jgi:hypothetical protein
VDLAERQPEQRQAVQDGGRRVAHHAGYPQTGDRCGYDSPVSALSRVGPVLQIGAALQRDEFPATHHAGELAVVQALCQGGRAQDETGQRGTGHRYRVAERTGCRPTASRFLWTAALLRCSAILCGVAAL